MIFNIIGGNSSSASFDLTIVGGITRPEKPMHNTIWIETDVEITSYALSATEPETPVEGMAWVTIGDSGTIKIASPIGGDWITVYPISAKQYVSSAWVDVTTRSYQDGEWVEWWAGELYKDGRLFDVLTNGFETLTTYTTVDYKSNYFQLYCSSGSGGISSPEKIDVTRYKQISFKGRITFQTSEQQNFKVGLATEKNTDSFVSSVMVPVSTTGVQSFSVPVPTDGGEFYLVLIVGGSTSATNCIEIHEIILE